MEEIFSQLQLRENVANSFVVFYKYYYKRARELCEKAF